MNRFLHAAPVLLLLIGGVCHVCADINIRVSVKFILNADGSRPDGGIGSVAGFAAEVTRGNAILAATGRGFTLDVVEYLDIQPAAPPGLPSDHWFNIDARSFRVVIETAALFDQATWRWNGNAINFYVNNSSSGQCSFPGLGGSISIGKSIATGTVLHEIGHFFNLSHTHAFDPDCDTFVPPNPLSSALADGDGLIETIRDHACYTRDQLSLGNFGVEFASLTAVQQPVVNTSWLNVMSYHLEDQLLDDQMDRWTDAANDPRRGFCTARTWFVDGSAHCLTPSGSSVCGIFAGPFPSVAAGVAMANTDDIVLIRPGRYNEQVSITKAITLRATRGPVIIGTP